MREEHRGGADFKTENPTAKSGFHIVPKAGIPA